MKKIITAAILVLSMLVSRGSFASTQSYGVTTTTDSSQNVWSTCLPKNPTFPGAFTSTAVCFTSSTNGGISGYSSAPVNIFTFPWLFWAGINVSGTSTLQAANITNTTFSGALTFSTGSSIASTITHPLPLLLDPTGAYTPTTSTVNFNSGFIQERSLTYVDSGLYATSGTTTCGIQETINELKSEGLISEAYIFPMSPCVINSPLVLQDVTGLTIGGNGAEGNNTYILINAPMTAAIYISFSSGANNNVKLTNITIYDPFKDVSGEYISETNNSEGVFHNIIISSYNNRVYAWYTTGQQSEEYSNINEDTLGSFFSNPAQNSGQSTKIDNYIGSNIVLYAANGGYEFNRLWLEGGGLFITETGTPNSTYSPFRLSQIGYVNKGINLYNVWNARITDPFVDGGLNLDANCNNITVYNPNRMAINNQSLSPVIIKDGTAFSITGRAICENYGLSTTNAFNIESCGTVPVPILINSAGLYITGGATIDTLTTNNFTTTASGFTTMTAGFTNVTLPISFSGLGFGCFFAPINVTNANVFSYGFTPTAANTFTIVSSSSTDTNKVWYECHGD